MDTTAPAASLLDLHRAVVKAQRATRLDPVLAELAAPALAQLRAARRERLVQVARLHTGDQTIGLGLLPPAELEALAVSGASFRVRATARAALGVRAEETHLKMVMGLPGRLPAGA